MLSSRHLIGIIFMIILAFQSCTKDTDLSSTRSANGLSINEARAFYSTLTNKSKQLMSTEKPGSTQNNNSPEPIWNLADTTMDKLWHIVEVPVDEPIKTASITNRITNGKLVSLTTTPNGICRLIVVKNKLSGKLESALMRITAYTKVAADNLSKNTYKHKDPSFTGSIIFTTSDNRFINGWEFTNGIPSNKIQIKSVFSDSNVASATSAAKTSVKGKLSMITSSKTGIPALRADRPNPLEDDDLDPGGSGGGCGKVTDYYQQSCYTYNGVTNCTDWEYIGSTYIPSDCNQTGSTVIPSSYQQFTGQAGDPTLLAIPAGATRPPTAIQFKSSLENKPFALFIDIPCDVIKKWLATAKFVPDQSIIDKLKSLNAPPLATIMAKRIAYIQNINNAASTVVNMDYFPVTVTQLPIVNGQRLTPGQFLHYIRTNMDSFTDGTKTFNPYNNYGIDDRAKWNSNDPKGSILALDILGPDNASVITSYSTSDQWTFTTIYEPMYGEHPVSGNRNFGYITNTDGSYTFYTRGVDRITSWDGVAAQQIPEFFGGTGIPFSMGDTLWKSLQNGIKNFSESHSGKATINDPQILRPDWKMVKDVLDGKKPLSTLSKDCPD